MEFVLCVVCCACVQIKTRDNFCDVLAPPSEQTSPVLSPDQQRDEANEANAADQSNRQPLDPASAFDWPAHRHVARRDTARHCTALHRTQVVANWRRAHGYYRPWQVSSIIARFSIALLSAAATAVAAMHCARRCAGLGSSCPVPFRLPGLVWA